METKLNYYLQIDGIMMQTGTFHDNFDPKCVCMYSIPIVYDISIIDRDAKEVEKVENWVCAKKKGNYSYKSLQVKAES